MSHFVCRYCGHGKSWHRIDSNTCLALDGPWSCDCPAWEYGVDEDELPLPGNIKAVEGTLRLSVEIVKETT